MNAIKRIWCSWMHGGGTVKRDPLGRINWQCAKCGRWCDPVIKRSEKHMNEVDATPHTKIPEMNITQINRTRNHDALQLMEAVTNQIKDSPDATEVFMLVKIGKDYHRFSSGVTDLMHLVSTFELAKFDTLQRMSKP